MSNIIMSCWLFVYVILLLEPEVFSQEKGFTGDNVILPCTYKETLQDLTLVWWFTNDQTVYKVVNGEPSLEKQYSQFINRTWLFPKAWKSGNFSLLLTDLKDTDQGIYTCAIPGVGFRHTVKLSVEVRPTSKTKVEPRSSSGSLRGSRLFLFLPFVTVFLEKVLC